MKDVRFNDLDYSSADSEWPMLVLSGTTKSYASLTAQIQALEKYNQVKQVSFRFVFRRNGHGQIEFKNNP